MLHVLQTPSTLIVRNSVYHSVILLVTCHLYFLYMLKVKKMNKSNKCSKSHLTIFPTSVEELLSLLGHLFPSLQVVVHKHLFHGL